MELGVHFSSGVSDYFRAIVFLRQKQAWEGPLGLLRSIFEGLPEEWQIAINVLISSKNLLRCYPHPLPSA